MAEDLGESRLRLTTDDTELDRGLAGAETKSRSFLDRVQASTGAVYKTVAAGAATVLGAMSVQGAKLNEVLNTVQAETGATGDDWESLQAIVRRENGRTTESMEAIGAATVAMRQDLGLTGAEADKYADRFFDAALVTKKSGVDIVKTTDDIADGFDVNVERALGSIDQLVASQEKWGGSLQQRIDILPTLAKALKGLNGDIDDGVALLNLASASGLSYSNVQQAVNIAVAKFSVPRSLKDIIGLQDLHKSAVENAKDEVIKLEDELAKFVVPSEMTRIVATLNAIEDPTQRAAAAERIYADEVAKFSADPVERYLDILGEIPDAQARTTRAVELFGPKAGPVWAQLAGAVEKAGGNLDSFNVTQAEAGDKATEVARKLDAGPIRSLKLLGESLGGLLADAGSNPLITGIASFGTILGGFAPNLSGKVAGGIGKGIAGGFRLAARLPLVSTAVRFAADQAATLYLKVLMAGDVVSGAVSAAWARVVGSAVVQGVVKQVASAHATAYLVALFTGDAIGLALKGVWTAAMGAGSAAAQAAGFAAGGAWATAFAIGALATAIVIPIILVKVGTDWFKDLFQPGGNSLQQAWEDQAKLIDSGQAVWIDAAQAGGTETGEKYGDAMIEAARNWTATQMGPAINDGLERAASGVNAKSIGDQVATKVATVVSSSIGASVNWIKVAHEKGNRLGAAVADGIHASRDLVDTAWQALLDAIHHGTTPTRERAKLLGQLISNDLVWGLKSKDPAVRAQARATKQVILDRLEELGANTKNIGKSGMEALRVAMKSKDADIREAARAIYRASTEPVAKVPAAMTKYGHAAGEAYANGLRSTYGLVNDAAHYVAKGAQGAFEASSPPGPESPLHHIDRWGAATGRAWIEPMVEAIRHGRASLVATVGGIGDDLRVRGSGTLLESIGRAGGDRPRLGAPADGFGREDIRVVHVIDAASAAALAAAGLSSTEVGQALADGVNASGLYDHLRNLQAMSES